MFIPPFSLDFFFSIDAYFWYKERYIFPVNCFLFSINWICSEIYLIMCILHVYSSFDSAFQYFICYFTASFVWRNCNKYKRRKINSYAVVNLPKQLLNKWISTCRHISIFPGSLFLFLLTVLSLISCDKFGFVYVT